MYVFVFIVVLCYEFVKKLFYNLYKLYGYDYFVYDLNSSINMIFIDYI